MAAAPSDRRTMARLAAAARPGSLARAASPPRRAARAEAAAQPVVSSARVASPAREEFPWVAQAGLEWAAPWARVASPLPAERSAARAERSMQVGAQAAAAPAGRVAGPASLDL